MSTQHMTQQKHEGCATLPTRASIDVCLIMQGEIRIKGQTRHGLLADDPALAEQLKLGMVFQNGALFDSLSVGENVGFMLYEHTRMSPPRVEVRVASLQLYKPLLLPHAQGVAHGQPALTSNRWCRGF